MIGSKQSHAPLPFLTELAELTHYVVATEPCFKPTPVTEVAAAARSLGLSVTSHTPVPVALEHALRSPYRVVVTGSFYVVGETPASLRDG